MSSTNQLGENNFEVVCSESGVVVGCYDTEGKAKRRATRENKTWGRVKFTVRREQK